MKKTKKRSIPEVFILTNPAYFGMNPRCKNFKCTLDKRYGGHGYFYYAIKGYMSSRPWNWGRRFRRYEILKAIKHKHIKKCEG